MTIAWSGRMKTVTHALLGFVAGTAFLAMIAMTTSCAGTKVHGAQTMKPPAAQLAIPVSCIDQVIHGTEKTRCEAIDPSHPDVALCGPVLVHFNCTKIIPKK
jgi:hypothetical protein